MTFEDALNSLLEDSSIAPSAIVKFSNAFEYPMFSRDQPAIGAYSQQSPENMAKLLCFVLCTQQTEWPRMTSLFLPFWAYLVRHDGDVSYDPANPKEDNMDIELVNALKWWGNSGRPFKWIWSNRSSIYSHLMKYLELDQKNGDTGFLLYHELIKLRGLGVPKAAFAAQLINGKMGCIDSINLNILGVRSPREIMDRSSFKKVTVSPSKEVKAGSEDEKHLLQFLHAKLTQGSYDILKAYTDFLEDLKQKGATSEVLWDTWCEVVANRIKFFGGKPIHVSLPNQKEPSVIKSYKLSSPNHLARAQASLPTPWNSKAGGSVVSGDHRTLVTGESSSKFINLFEARVVNFPSEWGNFIILVGSPAAGKSTVTKNLLNLRGIKHLNPDVWAELIAARDKKGLSIPKHVNIPSDFERPLNLKDPKVTGFLNVHLTHPATSLRDLSIDKDKRPLQNIVWETSCRSMEAFYKTVTTVKEAGYTITVVYAWVPLEVAQQRNLTMGRSINPDAIDAAYSNIAGKLDEIVAAADHAWKVDNTSNDFRSSTQITKLK